jgi:hypothetical protein
MPGIQDLSDAELAAIAGGGTVAGTAGAAPDITTLSDAELQGMAAPTAPAPAAPSVPGQISIPGLGKPSLIGMAKSLFETAKSGVTLPGDVYQGKVDPLSEQGIKRATDLASVTMLPSAGRTIAAKAVPETTIADLKAAATPTYQRLTELGNTVPLTSQAKIDLTQSVVNELGPQGLRSANAPRTYREITRMSGASDLNDIAIARDKMRDIANGISENRLIRVTGHDSTAARKAMDKLDDQIEQLSPGWVDAMKQADANWAAARRADKVLKEADKGQKGRLGSFDTNETRAKGYTMDELAAIKRAHQGGALGTGLSAVGAALNPFHGGIAGVIPAIHALSSPLTALAGVPAGVAADVLAKQLRKRALNQAVQKILSRSPVAQGRLPQFNVGLPRLPVPAPTLGLPLALPREQ